MRTTKRNCLAFLIVALVLLEVTACAVQHCLVRLDDNEMEHQLAREPQYNEPKRADKLIVKGKIEYRDGLGCCIVKNGDRSGILRVVNEDPQILNKLQKQGEILTFEGYSIEGSDKFFIERIDGKDYPGDHF